MIYRKITPKILDALNDTPVVFLNGARQTGKSTLVQWIAKHKYPAQYISLDDLNILATIKESPQTFLNSIRGPIIIDEVQKAPELFPVIKLLVDRDRKPGRFILTGSANVLLLPKISESLAGRIEILSLWPLAQSEMESGPENLIDNIFSAGWMENFATIEYEREEILRRMCTGGYPEALVRKRKERLKAWFNSYLLTIIQRDIRELAHINGLTALPNLISLLAARSTSLFNFSDFSRVTGIPQSTLKRYLSLFEMTFLLLKVRAWSPNLGKRLLKTPKILLNDTGLLCYLLHLDVNELKTPNPFIGPVFENFVIMELMKEISWSKVKPQLYHFRTTSGIEVDAILENHKNQVIGIEIKSKSVLTKSDAKGLSYLKETLKDKFLKGIIFYTGDHVLPMEEKIFAVPIAAIWKK